MGRIADFLFGGPIVDAAIQAPAPTFAIDESSIPAQIFGLETYSDPIAPAARISRREAIQLPAVKRSRDLIAGSLGGLPLVVIDTERVTRFNDLLDQPERDRARSVTMTWTVEDLLFEGVAYWRVTERGFDGYPRWVKRVHPSRVDINDDDGTVRIDGKLVDSANLIQFHSPNDALLLAGARAIRTCLRLDAAAANYADGAPPIDFFTPADGADPADDEDVADLLGAWKTARRTRATAYVPAALKYNVGGWNPEQLQLADARQHAVLEIARVAGIDPEELGVSTTSRTYANQFDRRKAFIDFTLGGYLHAIEDRLSLGDVTKRGYLVRFDLDAFTRSDTKSRYEAYALGLQVGAIDKPEIREMEGKPPLALGPAPTQTEESVSASTFAGPELGLTLDAQPTGATFTVDTERRTITGLAVPYGLAAQSGGNSWQFSKGSIKFSDVTRIKLLANHDWTQAIGHATSLDDTDDGLVATFKIARGAEGDRALSLAEDGVWDGLSGGFAHGIKYAEREGVFHATSAPLAEVSLTPCPAFDGARVTAVAASSDLTKENHMTDTVNETTAESVDMSAVTDAIKQGFESLCSDGPTLVAPTAAQFEVHEASPYRFDGVKGAHDFSTDLISGLRDGDGEAHQRVIDFMAEAFTPKFDVDTGNVTTVNPTRHRPDMYVDMKKYETPFYSALSNGSLSDITPFILPKYSSHNGLVAPHVEGVEPTPGAFAATSQTVTPSAVSGKVEITREVWDQGGNPNVSSLIWNKMVYEYFKALELQVVSVLDAASPTAIALTAGESDADLVDELEAALAELNFIAGGNVFTFAGTHIDLYKALAAASDTTGRKLLPIIGATNANGQARNGFKSIDVAGTTFTPAWSLGASGVVSESSYLVDPDSVFVANSAPQRLEFQYRVAYVDLAIWGYVAAAITDLSGVREITYDPVA